MALVTATKVTTADYRDRQGPIETLTLDTGSLGDLGDAPRLRNMSQSNEKNPGFILIFQRRLEILGRKLRIFSESPNDSLVMETLDLRFMKRQSFLYNRLEIATPVHVTDCFRLSPPQRSNTQTLPIIA